MINLNGKWKLYWRRQKQYSEPKIANLARLDCVDAVVPGNVELDLERAGILPEIFFGDNVHEVRKCEFNEWWYKRSFKADKGLVETGGELVFAGLDCIADVWVNNRQVGSADNMFIEHRFDVSDFLKVGSNEIVVHIKSAILEARKYQHSVCENAQAMNFDSLRIRKAAHSYGWDIMPRIVSAGIWRDVSIEPKRTEKFTDVYYATIELTKKAAKVWVKWQFVTDKYELDDYRIKITGQCGQSRFEKTVNVYHTYGRLEIDIKAPKLWWPKGYGKADLYNVTAELIYKDGVVDRRVEKIGIRQIKLDYTEINTKADPGRFVFVCNGEKIFAKGTNHVPLDAFHSRDKSRLKKAMDMYVDLGCNMVRCWGGNVYEDHEFFDLCDKNGIMVWQDFGFGCGYYPQDDKFQEKIAYEAKQVIRKLRNHASIAIWAGDNEVDVFCMDIYGGVDPGKNRLTRETLPAVVNQHDPYRQFLPSSPFCGDAVVKAGDSFLGPEQHLWGPRGYYKAKFYSDNNACFVSEIGYHGCPDKSSIKKFISKDKLWPIYNSQWHCHASNPHPKDDIYKFRIKLMASQIKHLFGGVPKNLNDFILASQVTQAEAKKYFIEIFRSQKWNKSGILWWNLIDGWPQFADSVVDYYYGKKLAYHYIKRMQKDVCVMITEAKKGICNVVIANDTLKKAKGTFKVSDADSGKVICEGDFIVDANANVTASSIEVAPDGQAMLLIEYSVGKNKFSNHYMFGKAPFKLSKYKKWLKQICNLPGKIDYSEIGK